MTTLIPSTPTVSPTSAEFRHNTEYPSINDDLTLEPSVSTILNKIQETLLTLSNSFFNNVFKVEVSIDPPPILAQKSTPPTAEIPLLEPKLIGQVTSQIEGKVTAHLPQTPPRLLKTGDPIYRQDTLETAPNSEISITLNEGGLIQLGPRSQLFLEDYQYSSSTETGFLKLNVINGLFRYLSGKLSNDTQPHTIITTPSANIGIRGSELSGEIMEDGSTTLLHLNGLFTITSRLHAQEITVYERGTTIHIPNSVNSITFEYLNEQQIEEQHQLWQLPNSQQASIEPSILNNYTFTLDFPTPSPFNITTPYERPLLLYKDMPFGNNLPPIKGESPFPPPMPHDPKPFLQPNFLDPSFGISPDNPLLLPPKTENLIEIIKGKPDSVPNSRPENKPSPEHTLLLREDEGIDIIPPKNQAITQWTEPDHGTLSQITSNHLFYIPKLNYHGNDSLTYTLDHQTKVQVHLLITPVNDPPLTQSDTFYLHNEDRLVLSPEELLGNDTDPDHGDRLTVVSVAPLLLYNEEGQVLSDLTQGTVQLTEEGPIAYQPNPDFQGNAYFTYTVQDQQGATTIEQVTVQVSMDDNPITAVDDELLLSPASTWKIPHQVLLANDNGNLPLKIIEVLNPTTGNVQLTSQDILFTPTAPNVENAQFEYILSDGERTTTATVTLKTISTTDDKQIPIANDDQLSTHNATLPFPIVPQQLLANDLVPEGQELTLTEITEVNAGKVEFTQGLILFTPDPSFLQQRQGSFHYTITDATGHLSTATVKLILDNQPPITYPDQFELPRTHPVFLSTYQLMANDQDPENDPLTFVDVNQPTNGQVFLDQEHNIVFTPNTIPPLSPTGQFTYQLTDGHGNLSSARVTLFFHNTPPTAQNDTLSTASRQPLTLLTSTLLENDHDLEGERLTVTEVMDSLHGDINFDKQGNLVFTPNQQFVEQQFGLFYYQVTDQQGNSDEAQVIIEFNNAAPVARPDFLNFTGEHQSIPLSQLLANDYDSEGDSIQFYQFNAVTHGQLVFSDSTTLLFVPDKQFFEQKLGSFIYEIQDSQGQTSQAKVTLQLNNQSPEAQGEQFILDTSPPWLFSIPDLLANDSDPEGDPLELVVTSVTNGQITLREQYILFEPADNFSGQGGFTYLVKDDKGGTAQAQVTLLTQSTSQSSTANDDQKSILKDQITIPDPLSNLQESADEIEMITPFPAFIAPQNLLNFSPTEPVNADTQLLINTLIDQQVEQGHLDHIMANPLEISNITKVNSLPSTHLILDIESFELFKENEELTLFLGLAKNEYFSTGSQDHNLLQAEKMNFEFEGSYQRYIAESAEFSISPDFAFQLFS